MKFTKEVFNPKLKPEELLIVTMIALSGMMLAVIGMAVYLVVAVADTWIFKTLIIVNAVCGVMFLGVQLYGIKQQFEAMKAMGMMNQMLGNVGNIFDDVKGGTLDGKTRN